MIESSEFSASLAGYKVDNTGTRTPAIVTDAAFGAWYECIAKS